MGESFTTNITCGGISSGTSISSSDKLNAIVKNMVYDSTPKPSTEYEYKSLGTWSTAAQVDTFFTEHTYSNGWSGLKIGNYVTIQDGTYNKTWVIAGFNTETATDGVTGGIVFIPSRTELTTYYWSSSTGGVASYKNSIVHAYINGTIKTNLSTILGSHIVERNVTLGAAYDSTTWYTSASVKTTAYLTLMSWGQLSSTFASHNNSYDDGEANYKLPLFDFITTATYAGGSDYNFWLRNAYGKSVSFNVYMVKTNGEIGVISAGSAIGIRPLMYLR